MNCVSKRKYTKPQARFIALVILANAYKCEDCEWWHVAFKTIRESIKVTPP